MVPVAAVPVAVAAAARHVVGTRTGGAVVGAGAETARLLASTIVSCERMGMKLGPDRVWLVECLLRLLLLLGMRVRVMQLAPA